MRPSSPPPPPPSSAQRQNPPLGSRVFRYLVVGILCSVSYILGSYRFTTNTSDVKFAIQNQENCLYRTTNSTLQSPQRPLDFETHHGFSLPPQSPTEILKICPANFTHYCPCQDPHRERLYVVEKMLHRERHCPPAGESMRCLVPAPVGYKKPFPWPKSRDQAWFSNVPFKRLTESKKQQNWVRLEGDRLVFPGGGTSFPMGVKGYIDLLKKLVPLQSGAIRTALDTGCGVASFGASLMDYDILTMSIAPRDVHEAQVQFALERGVPAMLGVLSTYRLPYPSRSFDMAHCSRCLVPWTQDDGLHLLEIDRVLRPGGYWVLSGPPINWRGNYKGWKRTIEDLQNEQRNLEDLATRLCWKKVREKGPIAVWQKPTNHIHCVKRKRNRESPRFCSTNEDPDDGWYKKMDACLTPLPQVEDIKDVSVGPLEDWPKRLAIVKDIENVAGGAPEVVIPPRINYPHDNPQLQKEFFDDNLLWERRVSDYARMLKSLSTGGYRNVMDMNAGFGGFAASLSKYPVWVMNVVPHDAKHNTLGIIYERGLIGTYMNWCEPFSTYPRSYDLIHAVDVFSLYTDKCDFLDIFIEMCRILRPNGTMIIRDQVDIAVKVKSYADQMGWRTRLLESDLLFVDML